jgi:hypothetical protein
MIYGKDYEADIPHYNSLQYIEGDHVMNIEIDMSDTVPCLYLSAIRCWDPPFEREPISNEKRSSIFSNVVYYLRRIRGISIETAE